MTFFRREFDTCGTLFSLVFAVTHFYCCCFIVFLNFHVGGHRRFGLTNLSAAREGKSGTDCRGEEHEVVLVWSVISGKKRVYWNKSDISHLFHERHLHEKVNFSWEARSGITFDIRANADPVPGQPQYDFLVAGVSFFTLPHVSELGGHVHDNDSVSDLNSIGESRPEDDLSDCDGPASDIKAAGSMDEEELPPEDLGFRLSMVGLTPADPEFGFEVQDELTSELFSNTLEALRELVTAYLPEAEEMVSRAIINAFSEGRDSQASFDSSSSCDSEPNNPLQIEGDVLRKTYDWLGLNVAYAPRPDVDDQKLSFLQRQVEAMVVHVKHERLGADSAARILTSVATVLGLKLKIPIPKDTIVLNELEKSVESEDLIDSLCQYGDVLSAAVSKGHRFGMLSVAKKLMEVVYSFRLYLTRHHSLCCCINRNLSLL